MTLSVRHGRRTPKQPLIPALEKWLINAVLFPQMCALIVSLILISMSRFVSSATVAPQPPPSRPTGIAATASSTSARPPPPIAMATTATTSQNPYAKHWPLRYHFSQWLRQEFVDEYRSEATCELTQVTDKCRTMSHNRTFSNLNNSHFVNVSATSLPSNGSAVKIARTVDTDIHRQVLSDHPDGPTTTSSAPKFLDSLLVSNNQCLFLDGKSAKTICDSSLGVPRLSLLEQYHLKFCDRYPLVSVLSYDAWQWLLHSHDFNSEQCEQILSELVMIDGIVSQLICEYDSLLERFDCTNGFSVIWSCEDCRKVYREWVCSMLIPFHINGVPIKPCRTFCERVEQRCPHLHPYGKGQYAGEPVFLCIDPNIPFNPSITPITPYADPNLCYDSCHLLNTDQNSVSSSDEHNSDSKEERIDCVSNSELLHNNMATNTSTTLATVTDSSAANH